MGVVAGGAEWVQPGEALSKLARWGFRSSSSEATGMHQSELPAMLDVASQRLPGGGRGLLMCAIPVW